MSGTDRTPQVLIAKRHTRAYAPQGEVLEPKQLLSGIVSYFPKGTTLYIQRGSASPQSALSDVKMFASVGQYEYALSGTTLYQVRTGKLNWKSVRVGVDSFAVTNLDSSPSSGTTQEAGFAQEGTSTSNLRSVKNRVFAVSGTTLFSTQPGKSKWKAVEEGGASIIWPGSWVDVVSTDTTTAQSTPEASGTPSQPATPAEMSITSTTTVGNYVYGLAGTTLYQSSTGGSTWSVAQNDVSSYAVTSNLVYALEGTTLYSAIAGSPAWNSAPWSNVTAFTTANGLIDYVAQNNMVFQSTPGTAIASQITDPATLSNLLLNTPLGQNLIAAKIAPDVVTALRSLQNVDDGLQSLAQAAANSDPDLAEVESNLQALKATYAGSLGAVVNDAVIALEQADPDLDLAPLQRGTQALTNPNGLMNDMVDEGIDEAEDWAEENAPDLADMAGFMEDAADIGVPWIAIGQDVVEDYMAGSGLSEDTVVTQVSEVAGSVVGSVAGELVGTLVAPGVGTVAGGIAGTVVGNEVGQLVSTYAEKAIQSSDVKNAMQTAGKWVSSFF